MGRNIIGRMVCRNPHRRGSDVSPRDGARRPASAAGDRGGPGAEAPSPAGNRAANLRRLAVASSFARDAEAVAAVEFALIAFPLVSTLAAVFIVGLNFLYAASLDHAATVTARAISTGAVSSSGMSSDALKSSVVCPALIASMNCGSVFVSVSTIASGQFPSTYYSMVNSSQSALIVPNLDNSKNSFCPGAGSQYVVVEIAYPAPVFAAFLTGASTVTYNGSPVNVILAAATFLSEPYAGAAAYSGC